MSDAAPADPAAWAEAGLAFRVEDGVAWLVLDRPQVRNAIHHPLRNALLAAIEEVRADPGIRAAVLTGSGSAFCAGADLMSPPHIEIPPERQRGALANVAREDGRRIRLVGPHRLGPASDRGDDGIDDDRLIAVQRQPEALDRAVGDRGHAGGVGRQTGDEPVAAVVGEVEVETVAETQAQGGEIRNLTYIAKPQKQENKISSSCRSSIRSRVS